MLRSVDLNDTTLVYWVAGEGPLALFLHGFPLDHSVWLDQLHDLTGHRRCVAPDLRGFGRSAPVAADALTMEGHADDVAALIAHLGEEQADVVGLSMGGYVALALWERHAGAVRSLALVDTGAEADSPEGRARRQATAREVVERGVAWLADDSMPTLLAPEASLRSRARLRSMIEGMRYETVIAALKGMRDRVDRKPLLPSIGVPVLVVVGSEDGITPPSAARPMAEAIPGARLVEIPGAGHMTPLEAPAALAGALAELWGGQ